MTRSERIATSVVFLLVILGFILPVWQPVRPGAPATAFDPQAARNPPAPRLAIQQFPAIADSFIDSGFPDRNYGNGTAILVGGDPANGTRYRGLVQFDVSAIPGRATITNATLRARVLQAAAGETVDAYRVRSPWIEGDGSLFRFSQIVTVRETAGVPRTREPVDLLVNLSAPLSTVVKADFRILDDLGTEVPSQVYGPTYAGGNVTSVHVVFPATVGRFESRGFTLLYGNRVPTIPGFRTKALGDRLWTQNVGSNYASLAAADLNNDGKLEVIVGSHDAHVYAIQSDGSFLWSHVATDVVDYFATAVDVDGDGRLEVVYATDGSTDSRIFALAANGTEEWSSGAFPTKGTFAPIAIADIDGNGVKTLFVGSSDKFLYAFYGNNGTLRWSVQLPGSTWGYGATVANLTGDSAPEILYTTGTGDFYLLKTDGSPAWLSPAQPTRKTTQVTASLADVDHDGTLDIVAGDNAINGNMFAFRGIDGQTIWVRSTGSDQFGGQIIVDFQDDSYPEIAFAMTRAQSLGLIGYNSVIQWTAPLGDKTWAVPAAADVDLDGVEDVLIGVGDPASPTTLGLYIINSSNQVVRSFPTPDAVTATPIVADLDGDGTMEIVFSSRTTTYAFSTGSLGHDFRTGAYNYNLTGRFLDGNSPDGAPLLSTSLGPVQVLGGAGVTWRTSDGTRLWANPGSDYNATSVASAPITGPDRWVTWNVTSLVQNWTSFQQPNAGIMLRARNESGSTTIASREGSVTLAATLEVQYNENADPRILAPVPDQIRAEDSPMWQLNLYGYAWDPDTELNRTRWDLVGVNASLYDFSGGNVTGNHVLNFQPRPNAFGNDLVTLFLFDDGGHYDSQPLWVSLTPVNDGPVFTPPGTLYAKCGAPYDFDFSPYINDVDTAPGNMALRSDDPDHTTVSAFTVTFSYPVTPCNVWAFVVLTVDDGTLSNAQAVAIRLTTDAPPQRIKTLPDVVLLEGQQKRDVFDLDDYFVDPDADMLFYTEGFVNVNVTIKTNHSVDVMSLGDWYGIEKGTFRAWDPTGAIAEDSINVTVIPVNDPPSIADFPSFVVHYDALYNFSLGPYVSDSDTPLNQIGIRTSLPMYIAVEGMVLKMLFPRNYSGTLAPYTLNFTIYANDTLNETSKDTHVTVGSDYPPQPTADIGPILFDEDTVVRDSLHLEQHFLDTDSSTIFYSSGQVNVRVTIKANHSVDFGAVTNWNGFEVVTFRAMDDQGAYAESTTRVTVRPVNDAPFFKALPVLVSNEPVFFFDVRDYVDDIDNPNSTLHVSTSDGNVRIEGFILIFTYSSDVRQDVVNLTVTDPWGASSSADLQIRITGPNLLMALLPWLLLIAAIATVFFAVRLLRTVVEHVFLIYASGIPLAHLSRAVATDKDPDLVASMFTAIQSFMNESFHSMGVGDVESIEMADHRVALARGQDVLLVVLYRGRASGHIQNRANEAVRLVEKEFGHVLRDWNGDVSRIEGVRRLLEKLYGVESADQTLKSFDSPDVPAFSGPVSGKR